MTNSSFASLSRILAATTAAAAAFFTSSSASAQLISLRTVPIATGEQYVQLPSNSLGMGGVGIALRDPPTDPFTNPALGARADRLRVFGAPTFYSISDNQGGGRTMTGGLLGRSGRAFGGIAVSLQELDDGVRSFAPVWIEGDPFVTQNTGSSGSNLSSNPSNTYAQGLFGVRFGRGGRTAIGVGGFHADLQGVDGMRRLYANSTDVSEEGTVNALRVGVSHELRDGFVEAVFVHHRVDITHEVDYTIWGYDRVKQQSWSRSWTVANEDKSRTNGFRASWIGALDDAPGWKTGFTFTANRKSHPKIPDYDLAQLPRDPGNSTALSFGAGIAYEQPRVRFGMDLEYEPAWSHTWAYPGDSVRFRPDGSVVNALDHTVDNDFTFSNIRMAAGVEGFSGRTGWQAGLGILSNGYKLEQRDHVRGQVTRTNERWLEWTPGWGVHHDFGQLQLRYSGRLVLKGFPDGSDIAVSAVDAGMAEGSDYLVPVVTPAYLPDFAIFTNQFSVSVAIGGGRTVRR
jgi:hypothetical protein